jgi:hypothetical protein
MLIKPFSELFDGFEHQIGFELLDMNTLTLLGSIFVELLSL